MKGFTEEWLRENYDRADEALASSRSVAVPATLGVPIAFLPGEPALAGVASGEGWLEITVADWRPAALNELHRKGRWGSARLKKRDRDVLAGAFGRAGVPPAAGRRRVSLVVTVPKGQRRWDKDAFWKSLLDGLVHAKALIDDGPLYCEPGAIEYIRGDHLGTTIRLEEQE